jgi:hypothetical protein
LFPVIFFPCYGVGYGDLCRLKTQITTQTGKGAQN